MDLSTQTSIFAAIEKVTRGAPKPVVLQKPTFAGNEWKYVKKCLHGGWGSSIGMYVDRFAELLSRYCFGETTNIGSNCKIYVGNLIGMIHEVLDSKVAIETADARRRPKTARSSDSGATTQSTVR